MNKIVLSIVILAAVVAVALGTVSYVQAQAPTPQPAVPGSGNAYGMMGGRGARGGMMGQNAAADQDGILHDAMIGVYAQKLGLTVDELNARLAGGETLAQIAASKGLSADQLRALMSDARSQAFDQAVKDGALTQAQADWMNQRGAGSMGAGMGAAAGGRGMRGGAMSPACPYYTQTNP